MMKGRLLILLFLLSLNCYAQGFQFQKTIRRNGTDSVFTIIVYKTGDTTWIYNYLLSGAPTTIAKISGLQTSLDAKQDILTSATNIKTINSTSLLGSGNIGTAPAWGTLTGTLASQTDLNTALSGKQASLGFTALNAASNLSDIGSAVTTRVNLGLVIGTNVLAPNGSAANLTSFPTLNQNTTGSAAKITTPVTINGVSFDGSANITVPASAATLTGTLVTTGVPAFSGDISNPAGSLITTIGAGKVTNAMLAGSIDASTKLTGNVAFASTGGVSAATSATTGTMTVNMVTPMITITPTAACTFNASGGVAGQRITFVITTSGTSSFVLTWGTNFRTTSTLATGTTTAKVFCVSFVCLNGTSWLDTGRAGPM